MANTTTTPRSASDRPRGLKGGAIAGIAGGLSLWTFLALVELARAGTLDWSFLKGPALPFLGERVMAPGFDGFAVVLGIVCHFAVAIAWGLLFGLLFVGLSRGATVAAGAGWGIVVWLGMFYVVLPMFGARLVAVSTAPAYGLAQHLVYGLAVAIAFLPFQQRRRGPLGPERAPYEATRRTPVTP